MKKGSKVRSYERLPVYAFGWLATIMLLPILNP